MHRLCAPGLVGIVAVILPMLGGCAGGIELAALGAVANAANVGGTAIKFGKVDLAVMTDPEIAGDAVYRSFEDLGLRVYSDGTRREGFQREILAMNPSGREFRFIITPVSPTVTFVRLDIGLLGNNAVGQLIMQRLRWNLEANGVDAD